MRHYETRTVEQREHTSTTCDGCGWISRYPSDLYIVVISVHEGEEGGRRDEYDLCDDCLIGRAPALIAAGSRAPLVGGGEDE